MSEMHNILEVKDLKTRFHTPEGTVYAVNSISFEVAEGETLAVVGESGCGKSVTMLSILRLIAIPPGEIVSGQVKYHDIDLLQLSEENMEEVRGKEIAMVFQDPLSFLNPVMRVGRQIGESVSQGQIVAHLDEMPLAAPLTGVLRGLTRDGVPVSARTKIIEVDPRGPLAQVSGIPERPARIAQGVLEALRLSNR